MTGRLRRELGLFGATAIGLGAMIGAGAYVVMGPAAARAGAWLPAAVLIAALLALLNAFSSAWLAAAFPRAGGAYEFGCELLGPWRGFAAGWLFIVSKCAAGGVAAQGLAAAWGLPPAAALLPVAAVLAGALLGIRKAGWLNLGIAALALAGLLAPAVWGLSSPADPGPDPGPDPAAPDLLGGAALIFFAFTGYARVATLAEEVRRPTRTIPMAMGLSLAVAAAAYLAASWGLLSGLGVEALAASQAPVLDLARQAGGGMPALVLAGSTTALLGVMLSQVLGVSRVVLAMARRGDLPSGLARLDGDSPRRAALAAAILMAALSLLPLGPLAAGSAASILAYYFIAHSSALRLEGAAAWKKAWAAAGAAGCLILAVSLPAASLGAAGGMLGIGLIGRAVFPMPGGPRSKAGTA